MDFSDLMRDIVSVVAVLGLLAGALHLARKRGFVTVGAAQDSKLKSVARISLTPTHGLHLVQTDRGMILIATHPGGSTVVEQYGEVASPENVRAKALQAGAGC